MRPPWQRQPSKQRGGLRLALKRGLAARGATCPMRAAAVLRPAAGLTPPNTLSPHNTHHLWGRQVPDDITDEEALLLGDILSTAFFCAEQGGVSPGDTVAVVGLGPVGLLAVLAARHLGAAKVGSWPGRRSPSVTGAGRHAAHGMAEADSLRDVAT